MSGSGTRTRGRGPAPSRASRSGRSTGRAGARKAPEAREADSSARGAGSKDRRAAPPGGGRGAPERRRTVRSGAAATPPRRPRADGATVAPPRRRRARTLLVAVGVVLALGAVGVVVARSPLLDVDSVRVVGVPTDRVAQVRQAAGVEVGDPILGFLPGRAAHRVEALPWVARARVVRNLPDAVRIEVEVRLPVGWIRAGDRVLVVDRTGTVIGRADAPPAGTPELTGVTHRAPVGGRIRPWAVASASGALGSELRMRIASVDVDDGAVTAQVVFGPQLRFGSPARIAVKARVASAVLASLGDAPVGYVDVSMPAAPVSG